jgi:galactokinase
MNLKMDQNLKRAVSKKFIDLYNNKPLLIRAPGRINLIGEHTDYNEGFVLPGAIDKEIVFAIALNNESVFRFHSLDFHESYSGTEINKKEKGWQGYLLGVLAQFENEGVEISGVDCVFGGNIPIGAGLSSSAALECGFATGLNILFKTNFSPYKLITMTQNAEHEYAGVMCGIMDQYSSIYGKKDHVFRLDCRSNKHSYFPLAMDDCIIALVNTKVTHELASSEYNTRRSECERGVVFFKDKNPDINSLRDINLSEIVKYQPFIDPLIYKRCHYVVSENNRVLEACNALENFDFVKFGELMYQSHDGLRNEYEVSCKELDILVDITKPMHYVLGARMMGGGFGGCTINLVKADNKIEFQDKIIDKYKKDTGITPDIYFVKLSNGVDIIDY